MTEIERQEHIGAVETLAKALGMQHRRYNVRSLEVIQILENGEWILFDPVHRGKDVAKMLYLVSKNCGWNLSEVEFRVRLMKEVMDNVNAVS